MMYPNHLCARLFAVSVALVALASTAGASADVITGLSVTGTGLDTAGTLIVNGGFGEDVNAFTDRSHQWNGDSGQPTLAELELVGADYIRFANDDRSVTDFEAVVTFAEGLKDVYLLIDTRMSDATTLSILNGLPFVYTGYTVGYDENGDGTGPGDSINTHAELWVLSDFTGTSLTFGPQGQTGNMYGIVAKAVPEPSTLVLLAGAAVGLLLIARRRRQA